MSLHVDSNVFLSSVSTGRAWPCLRACVRRYQMRTVCWPAGRSSQRWGRGPLDMHTDWQTDRKKDGEPKAEKAELEWACVLSTKKSLLIFSPVNMTPSIAYYHYIMHVTYRVCLPYVSILLMLMFCEMLHSCVFINLGFCLAWILSTQLKLIRKVGNCIAK